MEEEKEHTRAEYGKGKGAYKRTIGKRKRSIQEQNTEEENTEKEKEHMRENTEDENMEEEKEDTRAEYGKGKGAYESRIRKRRIWKRKRSI